MTIVRVPRLGANEDVLRVAEVMVSEGDFVAVGSEICAVESTKATAVIEAVEPGFVRRLRVAEGQRVAVGSAICTLSEAADTPLGDLVNDGPAAIRSTRKAQVLAETHGLDLAELARDGEIVRLRDVERALARRLGMRTEPLAFEPGSGVVLFGAGGHARAVVELVRSAHPEWVIAAAVDDATNAPETILGVPVVGASALLPALAGRGLSRAVLGTGAVLRNELRAALYRKLAGLGFERPALIHARAMVEPSASVGAGCQIFAGAAVGACAVLGQNVVVNTGAIVSHDCELAEHVHITPGAILAGGVKVGAEAVVGMGVTVFMGVTIGAGARIANGCHITEDVPEGAIVRR